MPAGSKELLAEAGYPGGFEVGYDCPNDSYANDEAIYQAVVAVLARIGVKGDTARISYNGYGRTTAKWAWSDEAHRSPCNVVVKIVPTASLIACDEARS